MRKAIGFRAEPGKVHWAVVEGNTDEPRLVGHGVIPAPKEQTEAQALTTFASRVRLLLDQYKPEAGMIRSIEPTAQASRKEGPRQRLRIEGVLLQTIDSFGIEASNGALATISGKLGSERAKKYLESNEFRGLDLSSLPANTREAVLVAVAAL